MTATANGPSVVDGNEFTVTRTISIAAPIDKVWTAITDAEHIARWFPQRASLDAVEVGAHGVFSFTGYGDIPVQIEEVDPPRTIAYRWGSEGASSIDLDHSTVFRFTLEPHDGGTQLTVVESGFGTLSDPAGSMEDNRGGWDAELDELVAYLEGGS